jgi:hypothetical protein
MIDSGRASDQSDGMTKSAWMEWLEHARFAPSGHNTQPWLLHPVSDEAADLYYVPSRLLPVEDTTGRFSACFLGVFVEALNVAAAAGGRHVTLAGEPAPIDLGPGAEPRLYGRLHAGDGASAGVDRTLLLSRRTSRLRYDGRPAPQAALGNLARVASGFGHEARFFADRDTVDWVVGLNADTLFYDLEEDDRRAEIGGWTHFSNRRAARARDGFSPRCLGFPGPLLQLFFDHHRLIRGHRREQILRRIYLRSMRGTAHVGYLKAVWQTPGQCFDSGRLLMRFWLELTRHGLVMQPFGSVITNERSYAALVERLGGSEGDDEIWLLFRFGYSAKPPASERLSREKLVR